MTFFNLFNSRQQQTPSIMPTDQQPQQQQPQNSNTSSSSSSSSSSLSGDEQQQQQQPQNSNTSSSSSLPNRNQNRNQNRNLTLLFGGLAFLTLSTLVTRRSLARRYRATVPPFYTSSSNHRPPRVPNGGAMEAFEALNLATINVMAVAMVLAGGSLWALDINSVEDARRVLRRGWSGGGGGGPGGEEEEEEMEEWLAGVLARKEEKERVRERERDRERDRRRRNQRGGSCIEGEGEGEDKSR